MIKVSVFYPTQQRQQVRYGLLLQEPHTHGSAETGSGATKRCRDVDFLPPGLTAVLCAMGHLYFDSAEAFQAAFGPHAQEIMADIPNYTDIQPTIQISEVKV